MTNDLHAAFYADAMHQVDAALDRNVEIAEDTFLLRVTAESIAESVVPGQFVMLRLAGVNAPLIGRPLAVYDVGSHDSDSQNPHWIDLVYLRKGTLTQALAAAPVGTHVSVWGPLGNGFSNRPCDHLIMAAGGIGQTPMLLLGKEALGRQSFGSPKRNSAWAGAVDLIYGARRSTLLAGVRDFEAAGLSVSLCTDDGSAGQRRLVPEALADQLDSIDTSRVRVVTCGPEVMMEKVAEICAERSVDCQVSMETPMACGIGICFSCVAKIRQSGPVPWDYKRTCVEGPVFDAADLYW